MVNAKLFIGSFKNDHLTKNGLMEIRVTKELKSLSKQSFRYKQRKVSVLRRDISIVSRDTSKWKNEIVKNIQ
jgi:hypothetical protein